MSEADDVQHLEYATAQGRTLITADKDFIRIHAEWQAANKHHAGIIRVKPEHKDDIGMIVAYLEFLHLAIEGEAGDLDQDVYNTIRYL